MNLQTLALQNALAAQTVTPIAPAPAAGIYSNARITVNPQGQVTGIASGPNSSAIPVDVSGSRAFGEIYQNPSQLEKRFCVGGLGSSGAGTLFPAVSPDGSTWIAIPGPSAFDGGGCTTGMLAVPGRWFYRCGSDTLAADGWVEWG